MKTKMRTRTESKQKGKRKGKVKEEALLPLKKKGASSSSRSSSRKMWIIHSKKEHGWNKHTKIQGYTIVLCICTEKRVPKTVKLLLLLCSCFMYIPTYFCSMLPQKKKNAYKHFSLLLRFFCIQYTKLYGSDDDDDEIGLASASQPTYKLGNSRGAKEKTNGVDTQTSLSGIARLCPQKHYCYTFII